MREHLKAVTPCDRLPSSLLPTNFPLPPTLDYGYPISSAQIEKFSQDYPRHPDAVVFDRKGVPTAVGIFGSTAYLTEELGYPVEVLTVLNADEWFIISLGDNYSLGPTALRKRKHPTREVLKKLRVLLEIPGDEMPKWYINAVHCCWREV